MSRAAVAAAGLAGLVERRTSPRTGFVVSLYNSAAADLDTDEGRTPWTTVCEKHNTTMGHRTRKLASSHLADPAGWCEDCGAIEDAKGGKS